MRHIYELRKPTGETYTYSWLSRNDDNRPGRRVQEPVSEWRVSASMSPARKCCGTERKS